LTVLIVFREALFNPDSVVFGKDLIALHFPLENYVRDALYAGRLPIWNPYIFGGSPGLAHPQYLVFYLPQMLFRLLPINLALSWEIAFHVWLAGITMYFLCRYFRLEFWIALICAIVHMYNSGLLLRVIAGHVWLIYALSWFPLAWLFLDKALRSGSMGYLIGTGLVISFIILTGHPTFPIYLILFLSIFALYIASKLLVEKRSLTAVATLLARFLFVVAVALGLSAVQLVPTVVMAGEVSLLEGYDPSQADYLALSPSDLMAFLLPHTYVSAEKATRPWEMIPYMGVPWLVLLPLPLLSRRRQSIYYFLGGIIVFSVVIAFGSSLGVYRLMYTLLPPFRVVRIPPRSLAMFMPAAVVLGGFGLQFLNDHEPARINFRLFTRGYLVLGLFILSVAGGAGFVRDSGPPQSLSELGSLPILVAGSAIACVVLVGGFLRFSISWKTWGRFVIVGAVILVGLLVGILMIDTESFDILRVVLLVMLAAISIILYDFFYRYGPTMITQLLLITVLCLDLGSSNRNVISATAAPEFFEEERVLFQHVPVDQFERVLSFGVFPNHYMLGKLAHIGGYNSGILGGYDTFLRTVTKEPSKWTTTILSADSEVDSRALDFLGVRYVVYSANRTPEEYSLVSSNDGYGLYANRNPLSRAFIVYEVQVANDGAARQILQNGDFDYAKTVVLAQPPSLDLPAPGDGSISIQQYVPTSGALTMTARTSRPGILVLSEPYYRERRVWINGNEAETLRANLGFIAVELPEGEHRVELRYVPSSLFLGGGITIVTILMNTCLLLLDWRRSSTVKRSDDQLPDSAGF
jgi:hypothetical protein